MGVGDIGHFFLEWATSHIKRPQTQISGGPVFGSHLELLKTTLTLFRLGVPNLKILQIGDIPGMFSNFTMPFHNCDPKLVL